MTVWPGEAIGPREEEAPRDPREGEGLHGEPQHALPRGQGTGHALRQLRVPRPPGSQGAVPPALDRPDQRGGPAARAVVLAVHQRTQDRRRRGRPQDPRGPRGERPGRVRLARRDREVGAPRRDPDGQPEPCASGNSRCESRRRADVHQEPEGRRGRAPEEARVPRRAIGASWSREPKAVGEALGASRPPRSRCSSSDELDPLAIRARQSGVDVNEVSADVMAKLTSTVTPQGIVGVCSVPRRRVRARCRARAASRSCTRCGIPGNAGTVLRSADAAGRRGSGVHGQLGRCLQPEDRAIVGGVDLPSADRPRRGNRPRCCGRARDDGDAGARDGRRTATRSSTPSTSASPSRSCSATRRTGCPTRSSRWRTHGSRSASRARRSRSTSRPPPPCACSNGPARRRSGTVALETIVAAAAHDIRSPLTAMKGFGYALEKRWESMTEEQRP